MRALVVGVALASGTLLAGCVQNYATREVAQGAAPATVAILNAPVGARVLIDGRDVGDVAQASQYGLTPGRHDVVVQVNGRTIHSQAVFASAGARLEVRIP